MPGTAESWDDLRFPACFFALSGNVDGAFVIRGDGVVESAGTFLKTSALPEEALPSGLGARHQAASGITLATQCVAISVSESTGRVCVFREGEILTELDQAPGQVKKRR